METVFGANGISYCLLGREYLEPAVQLVTELFVKAEYLISGCNFTYDEFEPFSRLYCEASLQHNLSLIAIDDSSRELVGFSINEDPNTEASVNPNYLAVSSEKFGLLLKTLEDLNNKFLDIDLKPANSFHLFLLGVKESHQGKGIGKTLVHVSEIVARKHNFNYLLVEATSPLTKPICEKLGFRKLGNMPYKDYEYKGEKVFENIIDYDGPYLFSKHLKSTELPKI